MKEATVTKLHTDHSKHNLRVYPGIDLKFRVHPCHCGGIVMQYVHLIQLPPDAEEMLHSLGRSYEPEQVACGVHLHPKWYDFFIGGFNVKVNYYLHRLKKIVKTREVGVKKAEKIRAMLEI